MAWEEKWYLEEVQEYERLYGELPPFEPDDMEPAADEPPADEPVAENVAVPAPAPGLD